MTDASDRLIGLALVALDRAAELGHPTAERFAAALRRRIGEPAGINDAALLAEVAHLEAAGNPRGAVSIVARRHGRTPMEAASIGRRLRKKRKVGTCRVHFKTGGTSDP